MEVGTIRFLLSTESLGKWEVEISTILIRKNPKQSLLQTERLCWNKNCFTASLLWCVWCRLWSATYFRLEDSNGKLSCSFVLGKSHVVPLKKTAAARVSARVASSICKELEYENILARQSGCFWLSIKCQEKIFDSSRISQWKNVATYSSQSSWWCFKGSTFLTFQQQQPLDRRTYYLPFGIG